MYRWQRTFSKPNNTPADSRASAAEMPRRFSFAHVRLTLPRCWAFAPEVGQTAQQIPKPRHGQTWRLCLQDKKSGRLRIGKRLHFARRFRSPTCPGGRGCCMTPSAVRTMARVPVGLERTSCDCLSSTTRELLGLITSFCRLRMAWFRAILYLYWIGVMANPKPEPEQRMLRWFERWRMAKFISIVILHIVTASGIRAPRILCSATSKAS